MFYPLAPDAYRSDTDLPADPLSDRPNEPPQVLQTKSPEARAAPFRKGFGEGKGTPGTKDEGPRCLQTALVSPTDREKKRRNGRFGGVEMDAALSPVVPVVPFEACEEDGGIGGIGGVKYGALGRALFFLIRAWKPPETSRHGSMVPQTAMGKDSILNSIPIYIYIYFTVAHPLQAAQGWFLNHYECRCWNRLRQKSEPAIMSYLGANERYTWTGPKQQGSYCPNVALPIVIIRWVKVDCQLIGQRLTVLIRAALGLRGGHSFSKMEPIPCVSSSLPRQGQKRAFRSTLSLRFLR